MLSNLNELIQSIKDHNHITNQLKSSFDKLMFDDKKHIYKLGTKKLKSTTDFISQFSKDIDMFSIYTYKLKSLQKQNPKFKADIKKLLVKNKYNSEAALAKGKAAHLYSEQYPYLFYPTNDKEQGIYDWFSNLDSKYVVVANELKVYHHKSYKAGTIDLLLYNKETGNLVIADWKTGDNSLLISYKNSKLVKPFDSVDCPLTKYSLQLSDYKLMIELGTDFKVEEMLLIHLTTNSIDYVDKYKKQEDYKLQTNLVSSNLILDTNYYKSYKAIDFTEQLKTYYK